MPDLLNAHTSISTTSQECEAPQRMLFHFRPRVIAELVCVEVSAEQLGAPVGANRQAWICLAEKLTGGLEQLSFQDYDILRLAETVLANDQAYREIEVMPSALLRVGFIPFS